MVAGFSIIDLENNYFLVKFQTAVDAERALTEGPWTVMGRNLFVQPWTPDFDCPAWRSNIMTNTACDDLATKLEKLLKLTIIWRTLREGNLQGWQ